MLGFHLAIDFRDAAGQLLAAGLLDVEFQRLEQRVSGPPLELALAHGEGGVEMTLGDMAARLVVSALHVVVLGADLVEKALEFRGPLRRGCIGRTSIDIDQAFQAGERHAHVTVLPGVHCLGIQGFLFLADAHELLLAAVHLGRQLQRA